MKTAEYRGMGDEQLTLSLREVTKNLFHLRFQSATERLETPSEIKKAKKEVARIKTLQRERRLLDGLLRRLSEAAVARIKDLKPERQLGAARAALVAEPARAKAEPTRETEPAQGQAAKPAQEK